MIALLAGCTDAPADRPEPRPAPTGDSAPPPIEYPAPTGVFADCPRLVHAQQIADGYAGSVDAILPLPGGDVIVSGRSGLWTPLGPAEGDVLYNQRLLGGYVARIGADHHVVWGHTFGDMPPSPATLVEDGVWIAGSRNNAQVQVDGVVPEGASAAKVKYDAPVALKFGLDGELVQLLEIDNDRSLEGSAATEDAAGNVYLAGAVLSGTTTFGPWVMPPVDGTGERGFVASWTASGEPRWLTIVPSAVQRLLRGPGGRALWALSHDSPGTVRSSDGWTTELPDGGGWVTQPLDLDTGHPTDRDPLFTLGASLYGDDQPPDALPTVFGFLSTSGWLDADGVAHTPPAGTGGFALGLTHSGSFAATGTFLQADMTGGSAGVFTGYLGGYGATIAAGTEREFTLRADRRRLFGHDSLAVTYDADGRERCGWAALEIDGGIVDVSDGAWDADGGLWLGGRFEQELRLVDMQGRELLHWTSQNPDGFLLHFLPP